MYTTAISGCEGRAGAARPRARVVARDRSRGHERVAEGTCERNISSQTMSARHKKWTFSTGRMRNWCSRAHAERRKGTR